jgi:hypothetical protein
MYNGFYWRFSVCQRAASPGDAVHWAAGNTFFADRRVDEVISTSR